MTDPAEISIPERLMTFEEFLAWYEALPKEAGRFELWDGRVIAKHGGAGSMNAERAGHARMKSRLARALEASLRAAAVQGEVLIDGVQVPLANRQRNAEPDVLLYLGVPVSNDALIVPEPVIVCEVLSPSTAKHDMSAKLEAYFTLPSVQHYIIGDPDKPLLIVHSRGTGDALTTRLVSDPAATLRLDPPGLELTLTEILGR